MFDTSKDILFVVLAFASIWVAIFLCWALYYCARILRNANEMVEEVKEHAHRLDEAVRSIRERMEKMSGAFSIVAAGITKIVGKAIEKRFFHEEEDIKEEVFDTPKKKK